jgi:hypothetical protein
MRSITNSYTELGTGMYYQENGQWLESEEKIEITPTGAAATKGAHKVTFAPNINTIGAINLTTPDGKQLRSHVLGLSYFDPVTGKSAMIAEIKDSIGVLHAPNRIIYPDAFTDIKADIRYTYTKAGFEQDVILQEQLPSPAEYGLDPETTRLEVLTEFVDPPQPNKTARLLRNGAKDETLDFGAMRIGRGNAFSLSASNSPPSVGNSRTFTGATAIQRTWTKLDGRDFLIEEVSYRNVKKEIDQLPAAKDRAAAKTSKKQASLKRRIPSHREARVENKKIQVASVK